MTNHNHHDDNDEDDDCDGVDTTSNINTDDNDEKDIYHVPTGASPGPDASSLGSGLGREANGVDYSTPTLSPSGPRPSPVNDATSSLLRYGYLPLTLTSPTPHHTNHPNHHLPPHLPPTFSLTPHPNHHPNQALTP